MDNTINLTVEEIASSQLDTVERLARQIWPRCYATISSPEQIEYMLRWMYSADQLRKDHSEGVTFLQLLRQSEPIGFVAWGPYPNSTSTTCKLHKLYLLPEYHGQGWGTRLLTAAMDQARQRGFARMLLNVNKQNTAAIAVYRRHGFSVREALVVDIGQGFVMDDFVMETPLTPGAHMPHENLADTLFARRNPDVSLANFADLLDRLTWTIQGGEDEIEAARARWLAGDDEEKVEIALLMDERFPYETKTDMDRELARIAAKWPRLGTLCKRTIRQWEQQPED